MNLCLNRTGPCGAVARTLAAWSALFLALAAPFSEAASPAYPAAPPRDVYVLLIVLDGVPRDFFNRLLDEGRLPQCQAHLVERGCRVRHGLSVFPTVTFPAQTGAVTGLFPGHSSIPGLKWMERDRQKIRHYLVADFWRFEDDLLLYSPQLMDFGRLMRRPETIFSRLRGSPTASVQQIVGREAATAKFFPFEFGLTKLGGHMPHDTDEAITSYLCTAYADRARQPRFTFCCYPDFDCQVHLSGLDSKEASRTLEEFDGQLGAIVEAMKRGGIYDRSYILLASDHGNTPVGVNKVVHFVHALESFGLKPKHRTERDFNSFVAWNALNSVALYIADPERGWSVRPSYDTLRAFPLRKGGRRDDLLQFLVTRPGTDVLLVQDGPGRVRVVQAESELLITRRIFLGEAYYALQVTRGDRDPWGYLEHPDLARMVRSGEFFSSGEWLLPSLETRYPDAVVQSVQIFDNFRTGDVQVSLQPGWKVKPSRYVATHGSMMASDMNVPLFISGPDIRQSEIACARLTDIYPTLLRIFGLEVPFGSMDGRPLDEILPAELASQGDPNEERRTALLPAVRQLWRDDSQPDPADLGLPQDVRKFLRQTSGRQRHRLAEFLRTTKERLSARLREMREKNTLARHHGLEEQFEESEADLERMIVWLNGNDGKDSVDPTSRGQVETQ
ncbi:MAG: alkaline phosphatase family protein [Planctomycetes bacterium]|nr:alkaline phosphatase family protein [Planctomycetota bacterium]